jgi:hypothetical protein
VKLARLLYGDELPDDHHGRSMLKAMVGCGLTEAMIIKRAPWLNAIARQALIEECRKLPLGHWSDDYCGSLAGLTNDLRVELELYALKPIDVDDVDLANEAREARKARDRQRAKENRDKERARMRTALDVDDRDESLHSALTEKPRSVAELVEALRKGRAWQGVKESSLRVLVCLAADRLVAAGKIESEVRGDALKKARYLWLKC